MFFFVGVTTPTDTPNLVRRTRSGSKQMSEQDIWSTNSYTERTPGQVGNIARLECPVSDLSVRSGPRCPQRPKPDQTQMGWSRPTGPTHPSPNGFRLSKLVEAHCKPQASGFLMWPQGRSLAGCFFKKTFSSVLHIFFE